MTESIAQAHFDLPHKPQLRRLSDILPPPATHPPAATPLPFSAQPPDTEEAAVPQVERVVRAAVEILGGRRPVRQLSPVLRRDLLTYLEDLQAAAQPLRPRLHKLLTRPQGAGILEVVALVTLTTGVRALAARFERPRDSHDGQGQIGGHDGGPGLGGWRCTALQLRLTTGDVAQRRRSSR